MKRIIENDFLKVTIDDHGAELVSIYDKEKDIGYAVHIKPIKYDENGNAINL